jgi:mRNA interferase RelE/StbE
LGWNVEFKATAQKQLLKLDRRWQSEILDYLEDRVAENPRLHGKILTGDKKGLWRYRVGDYRIICDLRDDLVTVLVLRVGHRKDAYR